MSLKKTKNVLCAIPCYNEAFNLPRLFEDVRSSELLHHCDVVFIDDASKDETSIIIGRENFPLVKHRSNLGYGGAVKTAFGIAVEEKYEAFVVFPGDHQRKAEDAVRLVRKWRDEAWDVVVGSKFHIYLGNCSPVRRRIGNVIFSTTARWLWNSPVEDVLSGFKVYRVDAVREFMETLPGGYPFDIVFSMYACRQGLRMSETAVACRYDRHTTKMRSILIVSIKMMLRVIQHYLFAYPFWCLWRGRTSVLLRKHLPMISASISRQTP